MRVGRCRGYTSRCTTGPSHRLRRRCGRRGSCPGRARRSRHRCNGAGGRRRRIRRNVATLKITSLQQTDCSEPAPETIRNAEPVRMWHQGKRDAVSHKPNLQWFAYWTRRATHAAVLGMALPSRGGTSPTSQDARSSAWSRTANRDGGDVMQPVNRAVETVQGFLFQDTVVLSRIRPLPRRRGSVRWGLCSAVRLRGKD